MQAVFEMDGGAGLFVTVASYQTPHLDEIDHAGIAPDLKCTAPTARVSTDSDVPMSVRAIGVWDVRPPSPLAVTRVPMELLILHATSEFGCMHATHACGAEAFFDACVCCGHVR